MNKKKYFLNYKFMMCYQIFILRVRKKIKMMIEIEVGNFELFKNYRDVFDIVKF